MGELQNLKGWATILGQQIAICRKKHQASMPFGYIAMGDLKTLLDWAIQQIESLQKQNEEMKKHLIPDGWICHPGGPIDTDMIADTTTASTSNDGWNLTINMQTGEQTLTASESITAGCIRQSEGE